MPEDALRAVANLAPFFSKEDQQALFMVLLGGCMGGLLQPIYARLNPKAETPSNLHFLWSPLLGIAAAGISVFVIAHTETEKALPLLFFSILCGLAFPAILASAVNGVGEKTSKMQKEVAAIADQAKSDDPAKLAEAVTQLKTAMVENPARSISEEGQKVVEVSAGEAVRNIAQTASTTPEQAREVVEQLKEVATVAQSAGYTDTAQKAADELGKLAEKGGVSDNATRKIAEDAASRIKGE